MMWNWLVGGLSSGSSLYLYDGSPTYPHKDILIKFCSREELIYLVLVLNILIF